MKRTTIPPVDYQRLSREELIQRLETLEGNKNFKNKTRARPSRPFNFESYPQRHVALKVAYFGWNYNGFASQFSYKTPNNTNIIEKDEESSRSTPISTNQVVTVEDVLFAALQKCRLIKSPRTCNYSRCGRTDAGVSATGQVIALTIRSSAKKLDDDDFKKGASHEMELSLCTMLNRSLPLDIRILGWSYIPEGFNARFDCIGREYHYFFNPLGLDLDMMQKAAHRLVGIHDFRNFCRKDPSRNITNYVREIFRAEIIKHQHGFYCFIIHGSAFLYHQVRCIMEILFRIGRGLEPLEVIDYLLDVERQCQDRPNYDLALEIPLVLSQCFYPSERFPLNWKMDNVEQARLDADLYLLWKELQIKALTVDLIKGNTPSQAAFFGKSTGPSIFPSNNR